MFDFIQQNWVSIVIIILAICGVAVEVIAILKQPREQQLNQIRAWLLCAITEAEKTLGGGTGQVKLSYVYSKFLLTFPALAKMISFEKFSSLVDEVLDKFKSMLETNTKLQEYVKSEGENK